MKIASLRDGSRDGQLVVVNNTLTEYLPAGAVIPTFQSALDNLSAVQILLEDVTHRLEQEGGVPFESTQCMAPLPRAYQWCDGSAYVNHVELVRKARGAEMPQSFWSDPLMYQGGSDDFLGPHEDILVADEAYGIDFEAEVVVITDDVPMGVTAAQARDHIKFIMLVNDVSLRGLIPAELGKGFGFFHGKPSSAFSPVAVTLDELGDAWDGAKVKLPLNVDFNGKPYGKIWCNVDMTFDFADLIAHAAKTRRLSAGCLVGSGTISNKLDGGPGKTIEDGGAGYACIAELRTVETLVQGAPRTPFMRFDDRVRIEMRDAEGRSVFGAIDQRVKAYQPPN